MAKQRTHSDQYQRARREFEDMRIEDKAVFLVEATVTTMARALEAAGEALARELDRIFQPRETADPTEPPPPPPAADTPEKEST